MNHLERNQRGDVRRDRPYGLPRAERHDLMGSFTGAIRDNPLAAALIGMGALWLFMGGNRVTLLSQDGHPSVAEAVAHGAGEAAEGAGHFASRVGGAVASTVSSAAGSVSEGISSATSRAGEYVSGTIHGMDAEDEYHAAGRFDGTGRSSPARSLGHGLQGVFQRHPVALGLAGLALGAGVAASLPLTEAEREAGEAVRSKMSESASQAREIAGAVADEVRQQTG